MKILKKIFLAAFIASAVFFGTYFLWFSPRFVVPILMYHRFGYQNNSLSVTPENFERQLAYLKNNGYRVISLDELVQGIAQNKRFGRKTAVITVDDGWEDNYIYAYPALKKFGFPATIFLALDLIGTNPEFLTWEQVKTMQKDNISFGCHTRNHTYLPAVKDPDRLKDEIDGCKNMLQRELGVPVEWYCYPTGGFTEKVKALVRKAGYKGACTTARGFADLNKDVYELKRVKVTNSDTVKPFSFRAKLSGYYNLFRRKKAGG
ncbi:MAG: polysaccharide deacetylase family protein [Candidatus Omnitrophica bacterium]|nr:polysaccharide deacetylase family protein [Candidatus Omnitrophota bacterium]